MVSISSQLFQQPITLNNGRGWDGAVYYHVAEQLATGEELIGRAPFVYRIGTPLLASLVRPDDLLLSFKLVNFAANVLSVVLLMYLFRFYLVDWRNRVIMVGLFLTMWHSPVRMIFYMPASSDPWLLVTLLAGLVTIEKIREGETTGQLIVLGAIAFLGVIFREVALLLPITLLFSGNPIKLVGNSIRSLSSFSPTAFLGLIPGRYLFILAAGLLGVLVVSSLATASAEAPYSFLLAAAKWILRKPFWTYLLGWLVTFGPILLLVVYSWKSSVRFLAKHQHLLFYFLGFAILGWIGGTDTERILFWTMPVVYILIGRSIEENSAVLKSIPLLLVLGAAQLLSQRLFWTLPDFPNQFATPFPVLTIPGSHFQYLDLFSYHGDRTIALIVLVEYVVLGGVLLWWLSRRAKKYPTREGSAPSDNRMELV